MCGLGVTELRVNLQNRLFKLGDNIPPLIELRFGDQAFGQKVLRVGGALPGNFQTAPANGGRAVRSL